MLASILFALLPLVSAIVTPTTPDGSTVINEGGSIDAAWTADDTGSWTNMTIQLMTGDNLSVSSEYNGHGHYADFTDDPLEELVHYKCQGRVLMI
jgi:hypothetical protein